MLIYNYNHEDAMKARADLQNKAAAMAIRAKMMASLREFFAGEDFLEVTTPTRIPAPALEDYIDAVPSGKNFWLRTSPELHMKRLLSAGFPRIYQTGPCFRKDEFGSRHLIEFTMLEWYRANADWFDILNDTQKLVQRAMLDCTGKLTCDFLGNHLDLSGEWERITVTDAFRKFADCDLQEEILAGRFEETLVTKVEPHLGKTKPTFLTEYPIECSGLSQPMNNNPKLVERWELYCSGVELGNACSELTNPQEQLKRFDDTAILRKNDNRDVYDLDVPFMNAINLGMPKCAGVAIGLDRLAMLVCGKNTIQEVNAFVE